MKWYRFMPWGLLIAAAVILLAWNQRIEIIRHSSGPLLQQLPVENLQMDIARFDLDRVELPAVSFDLVQGEDRFHVIAAHVTISYSMPDLITGRIRELEVRRLVISHEGPDRPAQLDAAGLLTGLAELTALDVPAGRIQIEQLVPSGELFGPFSDKPFAVSLATDGESTSADILQAAQQLQIERVAGKISLAWTDRRTTPALEVITAAGRITEQSIIASTDVDLDRLRNSWLEFSHDATLLEPYSGRLLVDTEVNLAAEQVDLGFRASFDRFNMGDYLFEGGVLDTALRVTSDNTGVRLESTQPVYLRVAAITSPDLVVESLQTTLQIEARGQRLPDIIRVQPGSTLAVATAAYLRDRAEGLRVEFDNTLKRDSEGFAITFHEGFSAGAELLKTGDVRATSLQASALVDNLVRIGSAGDWQHRNGTWGLAPLQAAFGDWKIQTGFSTIETVTVGPEEQRVGLRSDSGTLRLDALDLEVQDIDIDLEARPNDLSANGHLRFGGLSPELDVSLTLRPDSGQGMLSATPRGAIDLADLPSWMVQRVSEIDPALIIRRGRASLTTESKWTATGPLRTVVDLDLQGTRGEYDDILFSGLDLAGRFQVLPALATEDSATVKVANLQYGVMIEAIDSAFRLEPSPDGVSSIVTIDTAEAQLLGSRLQTRDVTIDPGRDRNEALIDVTGLDLSRLVEAQQIEGLEATGQLDGVLPVALDLDGVHVTDGRFQSRPEGGSIRYTVEPAQAESVSNLLTDIVIQALEDFRYDRLQADADYAPDGTLKVGFRIEGTSPALDTDRPVHLNINTEQNVLSLLESLRFTDALNDELDRRIQGRYEGQVDGETTQ